jgi:hypothetical protein
MKKTLDRTYSISKAEAARRMFLTRHRVAEATQAIKADPDLSALIAAVLLGVGEKGPNRITADLQNAMFAAAQSVATADSISQRSAILGADGTWIDTTGEQ